MQELLNQMTLKEKVGQLNQRLYGWELYEKDETGIRLTDTFKDEVARWGSIGFIYGLFRSDPWSGKDLTTGLQPDEALELSRMVQTYIQENTRLKIPVFLSEECPHGHQALGSISSPTNFSVGSSWNPSLYQRMQQFVAQDLRRKGAHLGLISTLDVVRDPRWGRTEECFSEDPFLTGQYTVAALKGLQGDATTQGQISEENVLAVLKHFAGQGSAMGGHNSGPVNIGARELEEIHLLPMQYAMAADSKAHLCMAAYNDIDGIPCHGNHELLNVHLREKMGFTGAVMSDGVALDRLDSIANDPIETAAWAIESGVDISLWDNIFPYLEEAVESGRLEESVLDQSVLRVLELKDKMGLFENPTPQIDTFDMEAAMVCAQELAEEAVVLLKNEANILPINLSEVKKIAVIGPNADAVYNQLGDYTPFKTAGQVNSLLTGLTQYVANKVDDNDDAIEITYAAGSLMTASLEGGIAEAKHAASDANIIILALGGSSARDFTTDFDANGAALNGSNEMTSGENIDLADLSLPAAQIELATELAKLNIPIVAVMIEGRPHALGELDELVDAILIAGYPGDQGGKALASILTGERSPSGKLAISIPDSSGQLPVYYNYRDTSFKEHYFDLSGQPKYRFGYGLSYTSFDISELALSTNEIEVAKLEAGETVALTGVIQNTGSVAGAEVIQVYSRATLPKVAPRVKELKGFKKIWLEPGESQKFSIELSAMELKGLDAQLKRDYYSTISLSIEATDFIEHKQLTITKY